MNSRLIFSVILLLGSAVAEIYYVSHQSHRSAWKIQPRASLFQRFNSIKEMAQDQIKDLSDKDLELSQSDATDVGEDTDDVNETDTDTDETGTEQESSPTPTPIPEVCLEDNGGCDTNAACSVIDDVVNCTCLAAYQGNGLTCTLRQGVSGSMNLPGAISDYSTSKRKAALASGIGSFVGVSGNNVDVTLSSVTVKTTLVQVDYTIFLPDGVDAASILTALSGNAANLVTAINQAYAAAGLPAPLPSAYSLIISVNPSATASSSPSASTSVSPSASVSVSGSVSVSQSGSASMSVSQSFVPILTSASISTSMSVAMTPSVSTSAQVNSASNDSSSGLSNGAIAGIVIGSVCGAILLVALIVFSQMRVQRNNKGLTQALAVSEEGRSKATSDKVDNQRL